MVLQWNPLFPRPPCRHLPKGPLSLFPHVAPVRHASLLQDLWVQAASAPFPCLSMALFLFLSTPDSSSKKPFLGNTTHRGTPKGAVGRITTRYSYTRVHSGTVHNSQNAEAALVPLDRSGEKPNRVLKKGHSDTRYHMDKPGRHHAQ